MSMSWMASPPMDPSYHSQGKAPHLWWHPWLWTLANGNCLTLSEWRADCWLINYLTVWHLKALPHCPRDFTMTTDSVWVMSNDEEFSQADRDRLTDWCLKKLGWLGFPLSQTSQGKWCHAMACHTAQQLSPTVPTAKWFRLSHSESEYDRTALAHAKC